MSKQASRVGVRNDQVDIYGRVNTNLPLIDDLASFLPYHTELNVYKNGTEQLLPVNTSEPTTSPILADIRYPTGVWRNKQYFTYRKSPTEATGKARIKSIKGNTLVWNQIIEPFSTTYYTLNRCTGTLSGTNTVLTATGSTSYYSFGIFRKTSTSNAKMPIANHKYFMSAEVTINFNGRVRVGFDTGDTYLDVTNGVKTRLYAVKSTTSSNNTFEVYATKTGSYPTTSDTLSVNNWWICDLTQAYGEGNEPTEDEFVSLFSLPMYGFNNGSLLNFNGTGIKTTGKNLVFKTIENAYVSSGGQIVPTNSNDLMVAQVIQGQTYSFTFSTTGTATFAGFFYAEPSMNSYDYNGTRERYENGSFVAPITGYVAIRVEKNATNIMVNLGSTLLPYKPYTSSTLSLTISTYFPTGMKDAGNGADVVYDELTDKAITRVGEVDLGDLEFLYNSTQARFYANIATMKNGAKLKCAMYETVAWNSGNGSNMGMYCSSSSPIVSFWNSTYTDPDVFKSAMSGVYLNYELITYTEESTLNLE